MHLFGIATVITAFFQTLGDVRPLCHMTFPWNNSFIFSARCIGVPLFAARQSIRVVSVKWHPLSVFHVVMLTSDNFLRYVLFALQ